MFIRKYQETPYCVMISVKFFLFKSRFHSVGLPDLTVHRPAQNQVGMKKISNSQRFYTHSRDSGTTGVKNRIKGQYLLVYEKERQLNLI